MDEQTPEKDGQQENYEKLIEHANDSAKEKRERFLKRNPTTEILLWNLVSDAVSVRRDLENYRIYIVEHRTVSDTANELSYREIIKNKISLLWDFSKDITNLINYDHDPNKTEIEKSVLRECDDVLTLFLSSADKLSRATALGADYATWVELFVKMRLELRKLSEIADDFHDKQNPEQAKYFFLRKSNWLDI